MTNKFIARWDGKIVGKRTSQNRTYTHAIVIQYDEEKARKAAYAYVVTEQDRKNYDYYVGRAAAGAKHEYFKWNTPEMIAKELAGFAAHIEGGFDGYVARLKAGEIAHFERRKADGYYEPRVAAWAGRLDLAHKEANNARWRNCFLGIVEAETVKGKEKWNRVAEVNRALKQMGVKEKLVRGNGYYYFADGNAAAWPATAVYVYRAAELSVDRWLAEYRELARDGQ